MSFLSSILTRYCSPFKVICFLRLTLLKKFDLNFHILNIVGRHLDNVVDGASQNFHLHNVIKQKAAKKD
jgi:hypothetical protein